MAMKIGKGIYGLIFIVGLIIAILFPALSAYAGITILDATTTTILLVILGALVGLLNITVKERTGFLIAVLAIALLSFIVTTTIGEADKAIALVLNGIVNFTVPAALVVALLEVIRTGKGK